MGQKKSVEKNEVLEKYAEIIKNLKGHYLSLTISSIKLKEKDWKATGKVQVGSSVDGDHWGELEMGVVGYDVNSDSAIATVMVSINNYINSPEFVVEMGERMIKSLENEANYPKVLAT
jgi:hypothetical protein